MATEKTISSTGNRKTKFTPGGKLGSTLVTIISYGDWTLDSMKTNYRLLKISLRKAR